jgi:hypothetical protein
VSAPHESADLAAMPDTAHGLARLLTAPRSLALLLAVSLCLGVLHALTMLPLSLIRGDGPFWNYPSGIMGNRNDMVQVLVGYLYMMKSPWALPVLFVPNLAPPGGTNIFWLDAVPWLSLTGKLVYSVTATNINLIGIYLFASLVLPGVAMTTLLAAAGQRSLLAAITGTAITEATPWLLLRWGHIASFAQFWVIFALALYLLTLRHPRDWRITVAWLCFLPLVLLNNMYLFAMVGACWMAALAQRRLDHSAATWRLFLELSAMIGVAAAVAVVTGILSPDLGSAGSEDFGVYSMNLASPLVPQMSGLIPGLKNYRVGMGSQVEGFAWLGLGGLSLLVVSLPEWFTWIRRRALRHIVLICLMGCFLLFALSNKVYVGSHLLLDIPLPERVMHWLGTYRSSGRFFWPVGYALIAASIVLALRRYKPVTSIVVLSAIAAIQVVDVSPIRRMVAESSSHAAPSIFDRQPAAALTARSNAVMVFPSFGCTNRLWEDGQITIDRRALLLQANMEFQLFAARSDLPVNTVDKARLPTDCLAEEAAKNQALREGTLYVYLTQFAPGSAQLGGRAATDVCSMLDWLHYCLIPAASQ